ncbi:tyrosine-type recombinase/integrase [Pseudomonas sp. MN1F]|uniref:tyrosine-type recombinase/integrase n=1 Tax=Pseudomonas sp. MN1F TaxID=1366632 RepID=UPI00128F81A0|nr:tyrosine-type recombinase/integrase [Pseudomonas sp. MN1F]MQG91322.1 tyrosine-type recombinase/integrase [Pseudomonas sp. MN1F]
MANNLELQGGTYHVRLAIPSDVQHAFGNRRILSRSLQTGSHKEAMNLRLPILATWKAQITAAREGEPLPADWQEPFIQKLQAVDDHIKKMKWEEIEGISDDPEVSDDELEAFKRLDPELLNVLVELFRMRQQEPRGDFKLIEDLGQMNKVYEKWLLTCKYSVPAEVEKEMNELISNPTAYKARSPITAARLKEFRSYRESRQIAAKTIAQQEAKLQHLSTHLKQTGQPLDFDCVTAWLDTLTVTSKTKQQYLLAGSVFWKWASKHDARWREQYKDRVNPFENHDLPQLRGKAKKDAARLAFTIEELSQLHTEAEGQGNQALADLIALGTYTGARIEELVQLRVEHLIKCEGIRCIDITDSKTAAGIRVVPVHPALAEVVARLAADSVDGFLIPTTCRNQYGIRSDALSKAFGRLKTSLGFGSKHVFHSIRASAITHLVRADVADRLIKELVGHETGTVTFDVYSQGSSAKQKLDAISKLPSLT